MEEVAVDARQTVRQGGAPRLNGAPPLYAALDLGTNNCRLLMALPWGSGFRVVDAFSRTTRLGEGLAVTGVLSEPAILRTLDALRFCAQRMARRGVTRSRVVATEACRRAANCAAFVERVALEAGLTMEIISAEEEARLALAGCAPLLDRDLADALVFDIGGGSTELIHVEVTPGGETVRSFASLPLGVVTLAEEQGAALLTAAGYERTVALVAAQLAGFDADGRLAALVRQQKVQMLGTSGTVTTLAGVHLRLPRYDRAVVDGITLSFAEIAAVSHSLTRAGLDERAAHPCIGRERADLVVAGCAILDAICRLWPVGRLRVADRGVREGVLLSMMRSDQNQGSD